MTPRDLLVAGLSWLVALLVLLATPGLVDVAAALRGFENPRAHRPVTADCIAAPGVS